MFSIVVTGLGSAKTQIELVRSTIQRNNPEWLEGRKVEFIHADMAEGLPQLQHDYYDLAYCLNVLYFMQEESEKLQRAVNEMAALVRPGGFVIAEEYKFYPDYRMVYHPLWGKVKEPIGELMDMSYLFEKAGLIRSKSEEMETPIGFYTYVKR